MQEGEEREEKGQVMSMSDPMWLKVVVGTVVMVAAVVIWFKSM